jgi:molecular chaperone GrpE
MKDKNSDHTQKSEEKHAATEHAHENAAHSKDVHQHGHGHGAAEHKPGVDKPDAESASKHQADIEKLKVELAIANDKVLRLHADFENMRKRALRERNEIYRRANEDIMTELLPVLDHLDLALAAGEDVGEGHEAIVEGFKLVSEQLMTVLKKFGLEPIDAEGQPFDTCKHESISQMPSETVPEGIVMTQTRRGYMLGDKLLRPVQVVVSAGGEKPPAKTGKVESEGVDLEK